MRPFTDDETNEAILKKWDDGDCISAIEMGGLGPGYEQVIQIVAIELLRRFKDDPYVKKVQLIEGDIDTDDEKEGFWKRFDDAVHEIDRAHEIHMSGAQAGAAKSEAWMWLRWGYAKAMNRARATILVNDPERFILVSKAWPSAEPKKVENAGRV